MYKTDNDIMRRIEKILLFIYKKENEIKEKIMQIKQSSLFVHYIFINVCYYKVSSKERIRKKL